MNNITKSFVALDLETTGLDPKKDKIIEIGAAKYVNFEKVDEYQSFINPGKVIDSRIEELTGISNCDIENAPYIEEVLSDLLDFIGDDILLGHKIIFDFSFLKRACVNNGKLFEKKGIDTLNISRSVLNDLPSKNLNKLCLHFNIEHIEHRALNDALATAELYKKLCDNYYEQNSSIFEPKELIYKVKKEGPITRPQLERLGRIIENNNLDLGLDITRLSKNEASRIIDNLRAEGIQ